MSLYNDISPLALMIIGVVLAVIFILMMVRICCDVGFLCRKRKEQHNRIHRLLLSNMIDRLKIPHETYFRKTSDLDKERHIWACEHCPEPEECGDMFLGDDSIDPENFCPNYDELKKLKNSDTKKTA